MLFPMLPITQTDGDHCAEAVYAEFEFMDMNHVALW